MVLLNKQLLFFILCILGYFIYPSFGFAARFRRQTTSQQANSGCQNNNNQPCLQYCNRQPLISLGSSLPPLGTLGAALLSLTTVQGLCTGICGTTNECYCVVANDELNQAIQGLSIGGISVAETAFASTVVLAHNNVNAATLTCPNPQ